MLAAPLIAEPDLSSPQAAARSLYQAMQAQDGDAIVRTFYAPRHQDQELARAFADLIVSGKKLADAAKSKYGTTGEAIGAGTVGPEELAQLDRADVKVNGDTAAMTIPGRAKPVTFHRSPDGRWQLVLSDFAGGAEGDVARQSVLIKKVSEVLEEAADEVRTDKYPTAQAAESAIQGKLAKVMIKAATQASSRPVTHPAR
jgi:hypothetical protein